MRNCGRRPSTCRRPCDLSDVPWTLRSAMRPESTPIDPVLTEDERDELRHLDYLSARVSGLLDSGAITAESHAAIDADRRRRRDAIERHGRYQAAIGRA